MAYEKECDIVLQTLSTTMQKYHLAAVNSYLVADGFKLSPNDLLAIMAILKVNDHIELIKESGLFAAHIDKSTMEVTFYGIVGITQKGLAFISNSSYLSEKNVDFWICIMRAYYFNRSCNSKNSRKALMQILAPVSICNNLILHNVIIHQLRCITN